ncbi:MAG: hypothetical protein GY845_26240 [Planctomycetes bacterium]|nr:hypothetical protein [Planctomycetota bacterium]
MIRLKNNVFLLVLALCVSPVFAIDAGGPVETLECEACQTGFWELDDGLPGDCDSSASCSSHAYSFIVLWVDSDNDMDPGPSDSFSVTYSWNADGGSDESCAVEFNGHFKSEGDCDSNSQLVTGGLGGTAAAAGKSNASVAGSIRGGSFTNISFTDVGANSSQGSGPTLSGSSSPGSDSPPKYTYSGGSVTGTKNNWIFSKEWIQDEQKTGEAPSGSQTVVLSGSVDSKAVTVASAMGGLIPLLNASEADAEATGASEITTLKFTDFSEKEE